jgi:hypothetical protein
MLTAHRLSFPTCLFHPRSIHLLCHLDSPSVANLPCLGLQQQTGPEVSELCGSYRVPSRSSLLPLCTLSPGESHSQANNLFFQPQSPLSPGESVVQLANKPHAVQHCVATTTHGKTDTGFPTGSTMVSQSWLRDRDTSYCSQSPTQDRLTALTSQGHHSMTNNPLTQGSTQVRTVQNRGCTVIPEQTHIGFSPIQNARGSLAEVRPGSPQDSPGSNGGGTPQHGSSQPFIACARVDTCPPCDCMRSFSMRSSHHLEITCPSKRT